MTNAALLGQRIRRLRDLRGLTQEELAEASELTPQYVSAMERGTRNVTLETLEKIAAGLRVEMISLFAFDSSTVSISKQSLKKLIDQLPEDALSKASRVISLLS